MRLFICKIWCAIGNHHIKHSSIKFLNKTFKLKKKGLENRFDQYYFRINFKHYKEL
jgi:hypothetical protein